MTLQREAPARHGRRTTAAAPTGARHLLSQLLHPAAWPPRRTAAALGAGILAVTAAGVLTELGWHLPTLPSVFDLDAEQRVAALFSAGLLVLAMLASFAAVRAGASGSLRLVGALFGFMAVDEFFALHEFVEEWLGIEWLLLYLPAFAVAGVLALLAAWHHRRHRAFVGLWLGGGAAWGVSQVLEKVQWDGDVKQPGYSVMMVAEEFLEMAGSALFVLAMVVLARRLVAARAGR